MAITLNDNIRINAGKPSEPKYLSSGNTAYASVAAVNAAIPVPERHIGLTVLIQSGATSIEYWYKAGVTNGDLIEKIYNTIIPLGDFITGATTLGYFSGFTGVQTLPINHLSLSDYDGNYNSLYNYYFRNSEGIISIFQPHDIPLRRGYVKNTVPVKSWIWNEYTGSSNMVGWILVDGDVSQQLGTFQNGVTYYNGTSTFPYTATTWVTGSGYTNGSNVVISAVIGSTTTGTTLIVGGRPFAFSEHNDLHFRTIVSETPTLIAVRDDSTFIYLSANTSNSIITASNGLTKTGQNVRLGGTLTATTVITDSNATPSGITYAADYSSTFVPRSLVDKAYVDNKLSTSAGGDRIFKLICQPSHGFSTNSVLGWSGGTYNKAIADGLYDGEILGVVSKCYNVDCFELTQAGYVTGLTPTLTMNCTYFLSELTPGLLTTVAPVCNNQINKAMLIATSSSSGWVLPYAAYTISSGFTQGGALIRNVHNMTSSPYAVTCDDYYIGASGGDIVQLNSNVNGQVIVVDDVCGNAGIGCEIQISGVFFGGSSTACINTPYGSMTFIYNGGKAKWSSIGFSTAPY